MESAIAIVALLAGAIAGYFIGIRISRGNGVGRAQYDALGQAHAVLATKLEAAERDRIKVQDSLTQAESEKDALHVRIVQSDKQFALLQQSLETKQKEMEDWDKLKDNMVKAATASVMDSGNKLSSKLLADHKLETEAAKKDAEEQVRKTTESVLAQFQSIIEQVSNIKEQHNVIHKQFNNVTRMLSTPHGAGSLAEVGLENALKALNLIEGRDFRIQYTISSGEAQGLRPDCLVFLPQNIVMVIDSKSSKLFGQFADIDSIEKEKEIIADLAVSMNKHLQKLASKNYKDAIQKEYASNGRSGEISIVWNVMYIPSESIIEKILSVDTGFWQKCLDESIILAGPAGLNSLLMMAARQVELAKQSEHHQQILDTMGLIAERFATTLGNLATFSKQFNTAAKTFERVTSSVNRNLLPKLSQLSSYGITVAKNKEFPIKLPTFEVSAGDTDLVIDDVSGENPAKIPLALAE